ncbi:MAG: SDR family NAD(P)-dependent oxidoreductase [Pseudomonadota bacterium]
MTGGTSGFGRAALDLLLAESDVPIVLGARRPADLAAVPTTQLHTLPLDLSSLGSVRSFCARLPSGSISVLALNAGMTGRKLKTTRDGFEQMFQVNYLAHFLMIRLLASRLGNSSRIILTGSGTHDPEEKAPPPAPNHCDVERLAYPETDPQRDRFPPRAAGRAYTASKLCCIMLARQLAKIDPAVTSMSFDPGFLPDTDLARDFPGPVRWLAKALVPKLLPADRTGTIPTSARAYADMIMVTPPPFASGDYVSMRGGQPIVVEPSVLARDEKAGERLWQQTNALLPAG